MQITLYKNENALPLTSGFTQAGMYSRRQFCADLEVYRPPEPLWNPRLREAATTLSASLADSLAKYSSFFKAKIGQRS